MDCVVAARSVVHLLSRRGGSGTRSSGSPLGGRRAFRVLVAAMLALPPAVIGAVAPAAAQGASCTATAGRTAPDIAAKIYSGSAARSLADELTRRSGMRRVPSVDTLYVVDLGERILVFWTGGGRLCGANEYQGSDYRAALRTIFGIDA